MVSGVPRRGIREVRERMPQLAEELQTPQRQRVRRPGAGRKLLTEHDQALQEDVAGLLESTTRGDPTSPLLWTCKSTRHLAEELQRQGHAVSHMTVDRLLEQMGYSLQANRKTREGASNPDRNAQFEHINQQVRRFQRRRQPVISVDTKKRELVGDFKNAGSEWHPKGHPDPVRVHDFKDDELGVAIPYGVYDLARNEGWVSVGIDHDTAEFAVESIRRWWRRMGKRVYPQAKQLLIVADAGGSNSCQTRLWKLKLQELADQTQLAIHVCHLPPGTSKWNKIEHRMFCHITENWRGRPLVSREVVVNLIGHTTTKEGLSIRSELDANSYPLGREVTEGQMKGLSLKPDKFHGEWNYTILPKTSIG
jgi:transposase